MNTTEREEEGLAERRELEKELELHNLGFLLAAQQMVRKKNTFGLARMKVSDELANLIRDASLPQLKRLAESGLSVVTLNIASVPHARQMMQQHTDHVQAKMHMHIMHATQAAQAAAA